MASGLVRLLAPLLALLAASCVTARPAADLLLSGVAVHDGTGAEPLRASVAITDGRISSIGPAAAARRVIDATGLHLLPALVDMHVHLAGAPGADVPDSAYLDHGIVRVRDLGGFADQLRSRMRGGPLRVHSSLATLNGEAMAPFHRPVRTPAEVRSAVAELEAAGAAVVKIHRAFPPALLPLLVETAHRQGLKVTGHIPLKLHPLAACRAGMDGIEHVGSFIEAYVSAVPRATQESAIAYLLSPASEPLFQCLADRQVFVTPTLVLYSSIARARSGGKPPTAAMTATIASMQAIALKLHQAGVPLLAGSDSSALQRPKVEPGVSLLEELDLLRSAGIGPRALQRIAGGNAARSLGLSAGALIAPGMPADLLLVDGDPARDWSVVGRPREIIAGGVPHRWRGAATGGRQSRGPGAAHLFNRRRSD